ncbi:iron dicitrate transporter FecR [Adhaeribacter aerolatus]|uniref:Iron dicitrate transporter FecR n=1 Tax=Adhaeribacter aerolatus TaxID=670289 RepID=A0A512B232_9BACT|nr:FecR family protein [Adhaeribacter aerolatus]GEO06012.1 iron dicitrate transporter FecR [Adhaeribacter aerolatus]
MDNREAKELLNKYLAGNCTEEEKALVESWYLEWQGGEFDLSQNELELMKTQGLKKLLPSDKKKSGFSYWSSYAAAAAVFVIVLISAILFNNYSNKKPGSETALKQTAKPLKNDAAPGSNKALLTLADGTVVPLDEVRTGRIAEFSGVTIRKTADGQVVYETSASGNNAAQATSIGFNQIATPRGGQHKIILPDGTKVWLNAASSLRYPVQFTSNTRRVELKGEGYFEVNGQKTKTGKRIPFFVSTASQTVEVLGTHFNINAYSDEAAVTTTLLEGAVKVSPNLSGTKKYSGANNETVLKPGQQAILRNNNFQVREINAEDAVAWKNGYFSFEEADLQTVMRQLSRWYDVDVVYAGEISSETFTGKVQRNMSLAKVLDILSYAQINFKMEGQKLIITP